MQEIYNELRQHQGKLTEFAEYLVDNNVFSNTKTALQSLRINVKPHHRVNELYETWKHGKFKTKDIDKHNERLSNVFKDIKRRTLKDELVSICDVMEEALKLLTLGIKSMDKEKLLTCKEMLSEAIYKGN